MTVAGIVASSKTRTTKNNTLMAYVTLEDETASMELLCFQKVIDRCGSYMLPNLAVLVKGRISVRDEKPPQILCDEIYPLEDAGKAGGIPAAAKPVSGEDAVLYLRVPGVDSPEFRHLQLVSIMFEGETPLKIRMADTGKLWGGKCLPHPAFLQECREWLGEENVVLKKK